MTEFYEGTPDTVIERLCDSIATFDKEFVKRCKPATKKQIEQLQNSLAKYHHTIPTTYFHYLRTMGRNDGGLLEYQWNCEPDIDTVLDYIDDDEYDEELAEGYFMFSDHWLDARFYLKLSHGNDNPPVLFDGYEGRIQYTDSFEKYLFHKAFDMYKDTFEHHTSTTYHTHNCTHEKAEHCKQCPVYGKTPKERMAFVRHTAKPYGVQGAWFSDSLRYFCYDSQYALKVDISNGHHVQFSCNDSELLEQTRQELNTILYGFLPR